MLPFLPLEHSMIGSERRGEKHVSFFFHETNFPHFCYHCRIHYLHSNHVRFVSSLRESRGTPYAHATTAERKKRILSSRKGWAVPPFFMGHHFRFSGASTKQSSAIDFTVFLRVSPVLFHRKPLGKKRKGRSKNSRIVPCFIIQSGLCQICCSNAEDHYTREVRHAEKTACYLFFFFLNKERQRAYK